MITATINNTPLDLPRSFTWELIQQSQLTSFDKLKGDCVPSISFPDTERNRNVLNHPTRFELKRNGIKEYENFELRSEGMLLIRGTLVLNENFSGFVRGMVGNLAQTQQDKLITDHALPEDQSFVSKTNYDPDTDEYCAPELANNKFFAGIGREITETLNAGTSDEQDLTETILQKKHRNTGYRINWNKLGDGNIYINSNPLIFSLVEGTPDANYELTVVSPQLFVFYTIKKLLQLNGFYLTLNELESDTDLKKLFVYNNFDITQGVQTVEEITAGKETRDGGFWTMYKFKALSLTRSVTNFNYADLLPDVTLKDFLVGAANIVNGAFIFNSNNTVYFLDREARITEDPQQDLDDYFVGEWELSEKKDVSLKFIQQHDSDDSVFSDKYVDLSDDADKFRADVTTYNDLIAIEGDFLGQLCRVTDLEAVYEWNYTVITKQDALQLEEDVFAWKLKSIDFQPGLFNYAKEKEPEEIKTCFSTLAGSGVPTTAQAGQSNMRKSSEAPFSPRLLFYTGNNNARNYTANYSLKFTGENNLIETRWKRTAEWWANRLPVTGYFRFPANILQSFNINEKKKTRHGSFIIKKMVTQITHAGIGATKVEAFKI